MTNGSAFVFFMKNDIPARVQKALLGFAFLLLIDYVTPHIHDGPFRRPLPWPVPFSKPGLPAKNRW